MLRTGTGYSTSWNKGPYACKIMICIFLILIEACAGA